MADDLINHNCTFFNPLANLGFIIYKNDAEKGFKCYVLILFVEKWYILRKLDLVIHMNWGSRFLLDRSLD